MRKKESLSKGVSGCFEMAAAQLGKDFFHATKKM